MTRFDWLRDEVILAMDLYVSGGAVGGGTIPSKTDPRVIELSKVLQALNAYPLEGRPPSYRNPEGVYLKLGNLRAIETGGEHGMPAFSQVDKAVWNEYVDDLPRLHVEAAAVRLALACGLTPSAASGNGTTTVEAREGNAERIVPVPRESLRNSERIALDVLGQYAHHLSERGVAVARNMYRAVGELRPLFDDVYVPERHQVVVVVGTVSRQDARMAIGRLLDYQQHHQRPLAGLAVLFPVQPPVGLRHLLDGLSISTVWRGADEATFRDSAGGSFL